MAEIPPRARAWRGRAEGGSPRGSTAMQQPRSQREKEAGAGGGLGARARELTREASRELGGRVDLCAEA